MEKRLIPFCMAALLAVGACGGGAKKDAEGFPPAKTLVADSIAIEEVLQPSWGGIYGDYAVLVSRMTSKVVFRYRLPDWTFVDSSFSKGGGPDDLLYGFLQGTNNADGTFWVSEPARQSLMQFGDKDGRLQKLRTVRNGTSRSVYFGQVFDNRILISEHKAEVEGTIDNVDTHQFSFTIGDSLSLADSLLCYTKTSQRMWQEGNMNYVTIVSYNPPQYKAWGDRLAVWYPDTRNMLVYRVGEDGKMNLEHTYGDTLSLDRIRSVDVSSYEWDVSNSELIAATDDYLFLQTTVYSPSDGEDDSEQVLGNEIRVYDWQMNPVSKFELDKKEATTVWVDPQRRKMYAYNPRLDFEQVYVYEYEL